MLVEILVYGALAVLALCVLKFGYDLGKPKPKEGRIDDD